MGSIVLGIFAAGLLLCILSGGSILYALLFGYLLFFGYGLLQRQSTLQMVRMSARGMRAVKNILLVFVLIGIMTAVWRAAGTIPSIIYYSAKLIVPSAFLLLTFLLSCLVSVLTGTAFGTAATIGVICMTIANMLGVNPLYAGGAILSGVYFGDRCSPMSTSALLVSELTKTDLFENIMRMIRTAAVPFAITSAVYLLLGITGRGEAPALDLLERFAGNFVLHWAAVLPAALIIVLSLLKMRVKQIMLISIAVGSVVCVAIQHMAIPELLRAMVLGYQAKDPQLAAMLNGGGVASMLKVAAIVCISSCYSGIFEGTGLLENLKKPIASLAQRLTPFGSTLVTSIAAGVVACNQTLTIMLTHQLCKETIKDPSELAITLEDSAVVIAPLIPWSIAGAVPIATVSAPTGCIFAACFLYLLPAFRFWKARRAARPAVLSTPQAG